MSTIRRVNVSISYKSDIICNVASTGARTGQRLVTIIKLRYMHENNCCAIVFTLYRNIYISHYICYNEEPSIHDFTYV